MSKGLGQKIGIKFTEDLVGDVSGNGTATPYSFYRWYITSTWSSSGRLYLYELEFFSSGIKVNTNKIISMAGSSRYSSSYDVDRLFDGSVPGREWDANGSLPHWVSIELDEAVVIDSFRWHTGTSGNKPKEFILQGSNDGINWVDIHTDESPNLNNWIDFVVPGVGNKTTFTVTGKEYQYVNGPLIDRNYLVDKVEKKGINDLLRTDVNGVAEFIIDTNIVGIDYSALEWSIAAQGYIPKTGIENDLTEEVLIEVVLKRNQLPNIEGLVLHLDATDHVSIINEPTIPQTIGGLMLNLNLDEWSDL